LPATAAEETVALSLLRLGADARAPRAFKEIVRLPDPRRPVADRLLEALGIASGEWSTRLAEAREWAKQAMAMAERRHIAIVSWFDAGYPDLLRHIPDPPIVLWVQGDAAILARPAVAIVGARRATPAGLATATALGRELAQAGLVVVSGLARGVDGAGHHGALSVAGQTVAVLGSGVDVIYPPEHVSLSKQIAASGVLLSEFPPGMPPLPNHFPLRNRIISGLSRAVVVIEASEKSGSLITAKAALEQGREVLAVPGSVASGRYRGSHALIKDGAALVETVEDVLRELQWTPAAAFGRQQNDKSSNISNLEATMAVGEVYTMEELVERTGLSPSALLAELGALEIRGRTARAPGGGFVRLDNSAIGEGDA
jgi:DNA processing protein